MIKSYWYLFITKDKKYMHQKYGKCDANMQSNVVKICVNMHKRLKK